MKWMMIFYRMGRAFWREYLKKAIYETGSIDFQGLATRIPTVFDWKDIELEDKAFQTL